MCESALLTAVQAASKILYSPACESADAVVVSLLQASIRFTTKFAVPARARVVSCACLIWQRFESLS